MRRFLAGVQAFPHGAVWLFRHPRYLALAFMPLVLGVILFTVLGWWFLANHHFVISNVLTWAPSTWYGKAGYFVLERLFDVALFLFSILVAFLATSVLASPLYEVISVAVERDLRGSVLEISFVRSLALMGEELKKAAFILTISGVLMLLPGLNVFSTFVAAFLLGWDFYDYPLARRGLSFRDRLRRVLGDWAAVVGLGAWLIIPFVQFVTLPLAVAGGTLLALDE